MLAYAFRHDAPNHEEYRRWLEACVRSDQAYGLAEPVLAGFLRVVTNSKVFKQPSARADDKIVRATIWLSHAESGWKLHESY